MKTKEEILKDFDDIDFILMLLEDKIKGTEGDFLTQARDKFLDLKNEYASQLQQEWIPVEVRLPEIEEDVMLLDCWKTTDGKEDRVDIRIGHLESFTTIKSSAGLQYSCEWAGTEYAFNITHWRPLPPLPQPYNPKQS